MWYIVLLLHLVPPLWVLKARGKQVNQPYFTRDTWGVTGGDYLLSALPLWFVTYLVMFFLQPLQVISLRPFSGEAIEVLGFAFWYMVVTGLSAQVLAFFIKKSFSQLRAELVAFCKLPSLAVGKALRLALCPGLLLSVTLFLFAPLEFFFSNRSEFWFSFPDVIGIFLGLTVASLVAVVLIALACNVINGHLLYLFLAGVFGFGLALYVQGNFLGMDYGLLDGRQIDWSSFALWGAVNSGVWLLILAAPFALLGWKKIWFRRVITGLSLYIVAVQTITLGVLCMSHDLTKETQLVTTTQGQFELSQDNNVIVFMLDSLDTQYVNQLLEQYPEIHSSFQDFTYFENCLSAFSLTRESMPLLLTGLAYQNDVTYQDYVQTAFQESQILQTVKDLDYHSNFYVYPEFLSPEVAELQENVEILSVQIRDVPGFLDTFFGAVAFRYAPHQMKQNYPTDYYFHQFQDLGEGRTPFTDENHVFFRDLESTGLSTPHQGNVFKFYELLGPHGPLGINEFAQPVSGQDTSILEVTRGCFYMLDCYMAEMKELGIYDQASIVIMADHGNEGLRQCTGVLIKPPHSHQETLAISSAPVSYLADWQDTLVALLAGTPLEESGFFAISPHQPRTRQYYYFRHSDLRIPNYMADVYILESQETNQNFQLDHWNGTILRKPNQGQYFIAWGEPCSLIGNQGFSENAVREGLTMRWYQPAWGHGQIQFTVYPETPTDKDIRFHLTYSQMRGESQRIQLWVNHHYLGEEIVTPLPENPEDPDNLENLTTAQISFVIPQEYFQGESPENPLDITLKFPDAEQSALESRSVVFHQFLWTEEA